MSEPPHHRRRLALLSIGLAFAYGAADQYLGSRSVFLGVWTVSFSQMSAPWLALAFLAGCGRTRDRSAAAVGLAATLAAVAGYLLMTLSPIEGVSPGSIDWPTEIASQLHVILPACLTGPAFGILGGRWWRTRSRPIAVGVAALFVLEPLARLAAGRLDPVTAVWPLEAGVGVLLALVAGAVGTLRAQRD